MWELLLPQSEVRTHQHNASPHHPASLPQGNNVAIDDVTKCHNDRHGNPGGQCIVADDQKIDLHFDGWKCYLQLCKPSPEYLQKFCILDITSPHTYEDGSITVRMLI